MWNNRIMCHAEKDGTKWYAIHEVYYNRNGEICAWSTDPNYISGGNVDDLIGGLSNVYNDALKYRDDILDYDMEAEGKWDWELEEEECIN